MTDTFNLDRLFLGRQPILDANEILIGYELLFRNSSANVAPMAAPGHATADVICKAFTEFGLIDALGGHKAFVIADAQFLCNEAIDVLPTDSVVFEINAALAGVPAMLERCQELGKRGFAFCLCDPDTAVPVPADFLEQIVFLKLNIRAHDDITLKKLLDLPVAHRPIPIASHVETPEDHQRALSLGFHFFQGYYFAHPTLVEGKKIDPAMQGLMHIINLLNRDAELADIEQAFKSEPALALKLLRLTNSVGIGLRVKIGSIRQAINVIGRNHIQRWLQLLLFSQKGAAELARNPLMQLAALKGNFMERLAKRCAPQQAALHEQAFLAGLMSLMPALLSMKMEDILEQLVIAPTLRQALMTHAGELGTLLELTERYDQEDIVAVERLLGQLGHRIRSETLNQCLTESIAWVQSLGNESDD